MADAQARCHDCEWTCEARNALGVGSQHAKRHGHRVCVEVSNFVYFGDWNTERINAEHRATQKG